MGRYFKVTRQYTCISKVGSVDESEYGEKQTAIAK